ncbi:MAG: EAL domain-containing protein [Clostridiales bacterium]|nr:EAL domain-containing protein [Clostridiales bacterium]
MKIKLTLYRKIQIIILMTLIIVFVILQLSVSSFVESNTQKNVELSAINTSVLLQKNLDIIFSDAFDSLLFIQKNYVDANRDDESIQDDLRLLTEMKRYIKNAFVTFNDGTFILEPYAVIPSDFDPRTRDYYKAAYESREVNWSAPYIDIATGNLVITSSLYVQFKEIDGVIGVDINLDEIPEILKLSEIGDTGLMLLVNDDNQIISASEVSYINKSLEDLNDKFLIESRLISGNLKTDKGYYYLRRLNQGNMRLIAYLPIEDISNRASEINKEAGWISIFAVIIAGILSYYVIKKTMKPIILLKNTMKASEASETLILLDLKTNDEIDDLIQGYNTLAQNVNTQNEELKSLSEELLSSEHALQKQYDKASELAYKDYLTGLPNRLKFEQQAKIHIADKNPFALFYIDLDNFKYINDTYGHNYGDVVLKIISQRFTECCSGKYFCSRLSGDEFGMLILEPSEERVVSIATKLLELASKPIYYRDLEFSITGSIGISVFPQDGNSFEDLLSNADIAMYEAKGNSKNQYLQFSHDLREELIHRVTLERQLTQALVYNEIYLCYQPLIDFKTKQVKGFEALARWENNKFGFVPPDVFIPIAEKNLFINTMGYFVLEEAIKFGATLKQELGRYYEINVNVSLIQLHLEEFIPRVLLLLKEYNYPPEHLNIEITESVALESNEKIHKKLELLRKAGINLSLDDFGSGYSSLNHLLSMNLTHLKIDRLIIEEAVKDRTVYKLIQGIVEFAHAIDLKVVAEGIEDSNMESLMQQMTIDFAQGYLYSKPINKDDVIPYLKQELS